MRLTPVLNSGFLAVIAGAFAVQASAQVAPGSLERTVPQVSLDTQKKELTFETPLVPDGERSLGQENFVLSAVLIDGASIFTSDELASSFERFLATRVGTNELDAIAASITEKYRSAGFFLSYAYVPEQTAQSGIVRIKVVEGYVAQVQLAGKEGAAKSVKDVFQKLSAQRPLKLANLERVIGLAREQPGVAVRDVSISREPGDPARNILTIAIEPNRVRGLAYFDNRGTIRGARVRAYNSLVAGSLAIPGDQLEVGLFLIPGNAFRYVYGQVRGSIPLNSNGLRFAASYSLGDSAQEIAGPNQESQSRQISAELSYPFRKSRSLTINGTVQISDWKSLQSPAINGDQRDRYQAGRIRLEAVYNKALQLNTSIALSQGLGLTPTKRDGLVSPSRPFADPQFTKLNASVQLSSVLARGISLRGDLSAQYSFDPLFASEEFAIGGNRIGRAFDFNEATGDSGISAMLELGYRLKRPAAVITNPEIFAYLDGGVTSRRRSSVGLRGSDGIASVGAGGRFSVVGTHLAAEVGLPIASSGNKDVRLFMSASRSF